MRIAAGAVRPPWPVTGRWSELGTGAADGVQVTQAEQDDARRFERLGSVAGDREASVGQHRGGNAGALEIRARLLHLGGAHPRVSLDRPAIHDRVGDRLEGPCVVSVQSHGGGTYSRGDENDSSEKTVVAGFLTHDRMTRGGVHAMAVAMLIVIGVSNAARAWGPAGHALLTRAAVAAGPSLPAWFRDGDDRLAELANAPDRWRALAEAVPAVTALAPDHFFDLDVWGEERLPVERWAFVQRCGRRGMLPNEIGMLPFAVLEEYAVLVSAFRDVREHRAGSHEAAFTAAGILAHLLGDAVVPLHVTRHHHGWVGDNPNGFTRDRGVHQWFESTLVRGLSLRDVRVGGDALEPVSDPPAAMYSAVRASLALVPSLYRAERRSRVGGDDEAARKLVRERLRAGAILVARFWRAAWELGGT